ncbi:MAG: glucose-6-phosphate isomerase [Flavobacteriales bacterium]|jgi:glucose-6-phosphate isomerase
MLKKDNVFTWRGLSELREIYANEKEQFLSDLFLDSNRASKFSIEIEDLLFDYSKNNISEQSKAKLIEMASECGLRDAVEMLFTGAEINETEGRSVLHTSLRAFPEDEGDADEVVDEIEKVKSAIADYTEGILSGDIKGHTGKKIKNVVNIGIGGSDLGPRMVTQALQHYKTELNVTYVSNVDGDVMHFALSGLDPECTLFIVVSKTFSTSETMANARLAKQWISASMGPDAVSSHFAGVSCNEDPVIGFGVPASRFFQIWDWVGGRFSLWSAVGLSVSLAIGYSNFESLLRGGLKMDKHFRQTPFENNIPVMMALIGIWHRNFWGYETQAVIPYSHLLEKFPSYLQQAEMESNGKSVGRDGLPAGGDTCPILWGSAGTDAQHAYFQLLHQGSSVVPCDFICACRSENAHKNNQELLLANFLAQPEALMKGKSAATAYQELIDKGMDEESAKTLAPYRAFSGGKPSTSILLKRLDPESLGQLIAMYEHKIFVQGYLWGVYSFDQWGVELGKELAAPIQVEIECRVRAESHDQSTNRLLRYYLDNS